MSTSAPTAPPRPAVARWLVPAGLGVLLAIGVLWSIPVERYCIAIYPPPPGCSDGPDSSGPALIGSVLLVFGYAALVVCALLLPARLRPLVLGLVCGALGLVFAFALVGVLNGGPLYSYPVY